MTHARTVVPEFMVRRTKLDSPLASGLRSGMMVSRMAGSARSWAHQGMALKWARGSRMAWLWLVGAEWGLMGRPPEEEEEEVWVDMVGWGCEILRFSTVDELVSCLGGWKIGFRDLVGGNVVMCVA